MEDQTSLCGCGCGCGCWHDIRFFSWLPVTIDERLHILSGYSNPRLTRLRVVVVAVLSTLVCAYGQ